MNREQLFLEIDEIYSEWHGGDLHIGKERENRIKEVIQQAINYTHSCTELKTFDIHECINEVTKSANKLSPWIVDARKDRSFRYIIKKAIDKMLYSN